MAPKTEDIHHIIYKEPSSIDQILSKGVLELSLEDRCAVQEEIHGVSSLSPTENPEFLEASLREMSVELNRIPDDDKAAYLESQILDETYVNSADFRLRFLRCDLFNAKTAAMRLVRFLDFASFLFGPELLQRPMRISDFTKDDKKCMQEGWVQIMPYRDQSGRLIYVTCGDMGLEKGGTVVSRWKIILYTLWCLSNDLESQQKGFVVVLWPDENVRLLPMGDDIEYNAKLQAGSPIRNCSIHWCLPRNLPLFHPIHVIRAIHTLSTRKRHEGRDQARVSFHFGNQVECLYKLKTYGIPVEYIPLTDTGNIKTAHIKQWMRGQSQLEIAQEQGSPDSIPITVWPKSKDVIFRRGTWLSCHPGNATFENIIEAKLKEHSSASQTEKVAITKALISAVQHDKGRFLIWDNRGWWKELKDPSQIHHRIAQKVRKLTGKQVAQNQIQTTRSSTLFFQNQDNAKRRKIVSPENSDGNNSDSSCCVESCWMP